MAIINYRSQSLEQALGYKFLENRDQDLEAMVSAIDSGGCNQNLFGVVKELFVPKSRRSYFTTGVVRSVDLTAIIRLLDSLKKHDFNKFRQLL